MKIQTFKLTIAVPDDTEFVAIDKLTSLVRNYADHYDALDCAIEVKEIEKHTEVEK